MTAEIIAASLQNMVETVLHPWITNTIRESFYAGFLERMETPFFTALKIDKSHKEMASNLDVWWDSPIFWFNWFGQSQAD